ncbi:WD40 repeat domain-containing protein [Nonomuraea sp. NPDC049152]|uniref:WD40 repeat domain-containing protein n=1 Tax=Nonomuraea sp. NPDC049152 TaxID=3154350 RepID=UPI0033CAD50A
MAVGWLGGRQVLVASHTDEESPLVGIWDLTTREMIGDISYDGTEYDFPTHLEIIDIAGRPTLVIEAESGIDQWDLATRRKVHRPIDDGDDDGDKGSLDAFASSTVSTVEGQALIITGENRSDDSDSAMPVKNAVALWDPVSGRRLAAMQGHSAEIRALAAGELDGRPVLLSGSDDNTVRLWDLRTRRQLGDPTPSWPSHGAKALAVGRRDGARIAVSGEEYGVLQVWDLTTRRRLGRPMKAGHEIDTLAITEVDGLPVVVAAGPNGLSVWNLTTFTERGRLAATSVRGLAVRQNSVVAVVDSDTQILARTWDLRTLRLVDTIYLAPNGDYPTVSLVGGSVFATVQTDTSSIAVWDLSQRRRISTITVPPPAWEGEAITFGSVGCSAAVPSSASPARAPRPGSWTHAPGVT